MSHNIAGMPPFARMPLSGMGMGVGMGPNGPHPESNAHPHPPPPPPTGANPKKKRRTNANVAPPAPQPAPSAQDLLPPPLSGYGDTIVASNPFDDAPPQSAQSAMIHGGPPHIHGGHPHHPHHMTGPSMRGMSPLTSMSGINPMIPHNMGNMSPMGNSPMNNHINHMGGMSPMNHPPMGGMSPMNNMGSNIPSGPINTMNNHMNMSHMNNSQMSGPPMGSPMNSINSGPMGSPMNNMGHNMGSPMGGPLGSPMNSIGGNNHNHLPNGPININNMTSHMPPNSPLNGPPINNVNSPLSHNGSQPHSNHMGSNLNNLGRPINGPMTTMSSMMPNNINMSGPTTLNNMNITGPQMNNMSNMNVSHSNQMTHISGPMGSMSNNMGSGPPMGHPMNIPPHGFQGPPGMGSKPMPVSAGKIYPPDQPMVFNSQNPNAPPIYPCGICHKEVHDNDQGILCESGCNFWFHRGCSGLSEAAFQLLTQEVYAEWVCDKCLQSKNIPLVKFKP
ncbi:protein pygopus [Microplitis demolitor]|uniref:protein pygopus n=1 Tax=Microplitis demolitor TaxID=69319 RepID=UPI0004CDB635|nr:protein pygopus [Microplitis demolitor]XP_008553272.1 protein pygopus [Microplitis demolitor]XP_008553273.1 protein pygopus [Microplitis demolitor]XP_008553274.1 protein pygopus [Microplitis demolitor]